MFNFCKCGFMSKFPRLQRAPKAPCRGRAQIAPKCGRAPIRPKLTKIGCGCQGFRGPRPYAGPKGHGIFGRW